MSKSLNITFNILSNAAGVTALVPVAQITTQRVASGTQPPYITMRRVSHEGWHTDEPTDAWMDTVEISAFAKEQNDAFAIDEAIETALNGKASGTYGGVYLICLTHDGSEDLDNSSADVDGLYEVKSRYFVNYGT